MSHVVGLSIRTTKSCPHLRGVVIDVDNPDRTPRTFEHKASANDASEDQLHSLGTALDTQLKVQDVAAVVIREAGFARVSPKNAAVVKNRLRGEGVALSQARRRTENVIVGDNNRLAKLCGLTPEDLDTEATAFAGATWYEAGSAALAALKLV